MRSILWTIALIAIGVSTRSPAAEAPSLVGAWQLVSIETIRPNGEIVYPFYGRHPAGLLMYDASGSMSVQIVSDPKPRVPTADSREAFKASSAEEKAIAIDGYYSYFGLYDVDAAKSTVTHHIVESLYPAERGETAVRHFTLSSDRLTLTAHVREMGEERERRLVWQRAVAAPSGKP